MGPRRPPIGRVVSAAVEYAILASIIGFMVYALTGPPRHGL